MAVLDCLVRGGTHVWVLCFTHGEASTLHGRPGDLAVVRRPSSTPQPPFSGSGGPGC